MARNHFLELLLELRLKVYHELAISCLHDNQGSNLSGLFRACRQTHQDIKDEYASSVIPILDIMKRGTKLYSCNVNFKLDFEYQGNLLHFISISSIAVLAHHLKRHGADSPREECHKARIDCLRSACRLSHQTLSIHISRGRWGTCPAAKQLFNTLRDIHDGRDAFGNATRLILRGDLFFHDAEILSDDLLHEMQRTDSYEPNATSPYRKVYHAWVARAQDATSPRGACMLGYDFEEGLSEVKGVVYRDGVRMA